MWGVDLQILSKERKLDEGSDLGQSLEAEEEDQENFNVNGLARDMIHDRRTIQCCLILVVKIKTWLLYLSFFLYFADEVNVSLIFSRCFNESD